MLIRKEQIPISKISYLDDDISINHTENSKLSPFEACIILALTEHVGEHEGINVYNLDDINLEQGWNGAPIAAAAQSDELLEKLGPGLHIVENMDYGDLGVLDGHHRLMKSKMEGLFYVVTQLFPLSHPNIIIDTWLENFKPLTAEQVKIYLKTPKSIVPPKATKFQVVDINGQKRHIMEIQPNVQVKRDILTGKNDQNKFKI